MIYTSSDWFTTGAASGTVDISNTTLSRYNTLPSNSVCSIIFNTNGTITVQADQAAPSNWLLTGSPSEFSIRIVTTSGTLNVGTADTWLLLSSQQTFTVQQTTAGIKTFTGTMQIRRNSDLTIVDTATLSLTAELEDTGGGGAGGGGGGGVGGGGGRNPPNEN